MTQQIDTVIEKLFKKLEEKKAEVAAAKKASTVQWITTCTYTIGATRINLQTASDSEVVSLYADVQAQIEGRKKAADLIFGAGAKIDGLDKVQGFTAAEWLADCQKRASVAALRARTAELATLEERLNAVVSPEQRRALEVAALTAALGE